MQSQLINGIDFLNMLDNGCKALANECEKINSLNVFPVPDGDTGTNMKMTLEGGVFEGKRVQEESIGEMSGKIARAMVLSARGNSGVITSQFFKGVASYFKDYDNITIEQFAKGMIEGYKKAYSVVSNPTEGTILTVMREACDNTYDEISNIESLEGYLENLNKYAKESLKRTPDLLPVLKKAGVIDSGGAGFCLIIDGMLKFLKGEELESINFNENVNIVNTSSFNKDSELTYGYCTEFILQLQTSKVDPDTFDLNIINDYLNSIGNSIVSFKDDDIIKVHVHTFTPGAVLSECQKYGEFLTLKIENMNVSHTEGEATEVKSVEYKDFAIVSVSNGSGIESAFKEMGVDIVLSGGQTMNTSTSDFVNAFDKLNAKNILVYPNNSNIILAAQMASEEYTKSNVIVIPTKTISEGYSAIAMLDYDSLEVDQILAQQKEIISNVSTLEVTYSIRDAIIDDVEVKKGDYIAIYNHKLYSSNQSRIECIKEAISKIEDFDSKQVLVAFCGSDSNSEEFEAISQFILEKNSFIEIYPVEGNQDVYSYIIGIE